ALSPVGCVARGAERPGSPAARAEVNDTDQLMSRGPVHPDVRGRDRRTLPRPGAEDRPTALRATTSTHLHLLHQCAERQARARPAERHSSLRLRCPSALTHLLLPTRRRTPGITGRACGSE